MRAAEFVAEVSVLKEKLRALSSEQTSESPRHLQRALRQRDEWIEQLEARAATADARADMVQAELEAVQEKLAQVGVSSSAQSGRGELEALRTRLAAVEAASQAAEDRCEALCAELESERAKNEERTQQLGALRQSEERQDETLEDDLGRLEAQLVGRGRAIQELERQLRESQRAGRELVWRLEELQAQVGGGDPLQGWESAQEVPTSPIDPLTGESGVQDRPWATSRPMLSSESLSVQQSELGEAEPHLEAMVSRTAELEADLVAARWVVAKLEAQLSALGARDAELQARLAEARADLQRQATLLTQGQAAHRPE